MKTSTLLVTLLIFVLGSCQAQKKENTSSDNTVVETKESSHFPIILGAERYMAYLPFLEGKKVGVVTNQTGVLTDALNGANKDYIHLVDYLINKGINVKKIFAPEHGFRGKADAGEKVADGKDIKTGLPIISLYGKNRKPKQEQIAPLDVIVFDIQDVGVRFYTYISTLHLAMEAAAEKGIPVIVLDRPNPNGHYVDGPVLEKKYQSFVGMHRVPVVYGMTIGEYAKMINGEAWLSGGLKCDLKVITMEKYDHQKSYSLPVRPSPNLPNNQSINLYPSLCFFEGTNVSVGRGTDMQFQVYGTPFGENTSFSFVPQPNFGAKNPKHMGMKVFGEDLRKHPRLKKLNLSWLIKAYQENNHQAFFNSNLFFDKLAGTDKLRKQILEGKTENEIRDSWQINLEAFKKVREKYLLYP